jgi:hypothetical protein
MIHRGLAARACGSTGDDPADPDRCDAVFVTRLANGRIADVWGIARMPFQSGQSKTPAM